jgi:hypothetical protein
MYVKPEKLLQTLIIVSKEIRYWCLMASYETQMKFGNLSKTLCKLYP